MEIGEEIFEGTDCAREEGEHKLDTRESGHNKALGRRGEEAAVRYLEHMDYEILDRNWTCPAGEADVVAFDGCTLVFVEVKTRTDISKGLPAEAVDAEKRARYEMIAAWYLKDHFIVEVPVRFDVIGLLVVAPDRALVRHYVNAFGGGL